MEYEFTLKLDQNQRPFFRRLSTFMCEECGALVCEDQEQKHRDWHDNLITREPRS